MKQKNGVTIKFVPAKQRRTLSTGYMIRTTRELMGWTQQELAKRSGIASTNISMLETNRLALGKDRAVKLARAFGIHPATLMFPDWQIQKAA